LPNNGLLRQRLLAIVKKANEKVAQQHANDSKSNREDQIIKTETESVPNPSTSQIDKDPSMASSNYSQLPSKYDWNNLDTYAKIMQSMEEDRERQEKHKIQEQIKADLDKQVRDARDRKKREQRDNIEYFKNVTIEVEQWKDYDNKIAADRRQKAAIEKIDRDEQLRFDAQRRVEEQRKREAEDKDLLSRITLELETEEKDRIEKKQRDKQVIKQLMSENDRERQRKSELKKFAVQIELDQIKESNELIEKREREREAEMNHRVERQKLLMKKMEENVIKTIQAKADDDNHRALQQQAERDVRQMEIEKFKKEKLEKMRQEMLETLNEQIAEKKERKKEENEMKELHAQILQADTAEFQEYENRRRELQKKIYRKYREQLRDQIQNIRENRKREDGSMNEEEIRMNRDLIEVVEKVLREESVVGLHDNS